MGLCGCKGFERDRDEDDKGKVDRKLIVGNL